MTGSLDVLGLLAVVGSGVTAGVLFAVALSVLPALNAMPPDRYVYTHQLIGRNWDPTMPVIVLTSAAAALLLAIRTPAPAAWWYAVGTLLLVAVSVVSHFCNVPLNRGVKSLDPLRIPPGWRDPRPLWRRWHLLRTVLALAASVVNVVALTLT
jgi:uncharacterized membrane protein